MSDVLDGRTVYADSFRLDDSARPLHAFAAAVAARLAGEPQAAP